MKTNELSTCFCTNDVDACREFYTEYFSAKTTFGGAGVILNFKVDDVDAEYSRLIEAGLQTAMPFEDHPWGDRGFSVIDPIGNSVYIYSDREPSDEFKQYFKG